MIAAVKISPYLDTSQVSISPSYLTGQGISWNMRAVLVDWLVQVQLKLKLQQETLYMAAGITDCFLQVNLEQHILAKYLMELSIVDYEMVSFPQSEAAIAAYCLVQKSFSGCQWTSALQYHMSYNEEDLLAVGQCTARNVMLMNVGLTKQMAIKNKYASCINYKMSTVGQLDSSIIPNLDQPLI